MPAPDDSSTSTAPVRSPVRPAGQIAVLLMPAVALPSPYCCHRARGGGHVQRPPPADRGWHSRSRCISCSWHSRNELANTPPAGSLQRTEGCRGSCGTPPFDALLLLCYQRTGRGAGIGGLIRFTRGQCVGPTTLAQLPANKSCAQAAACAGDGWAWVGIATVGIQTAENRFQKTVKTNAQNNLTLWHYPANISSVFEKKKTEFCSSL
ncbi:hypothetical protein FHW67_000366 [Herbaspirillum sp. Sphag1AN]|nr:hypothetical protein [Herbaspirillum sp. Sphag1AN]MBB3244760.1 hypothetical protein [Herbaspirillum sp. Sphag64]